MNRSPKVWTTHDELDGNNFLENVAINVGLAFDKLMASDNYLEVDLDSVV